MADRTISQLDPATELFDNDLLVLEQTGVAKKMAGSVLHQYIVGVGGIDHIAMNSDYTLTIYYTNGTSYTTESIRGATGATGTISRIARTSGTGAPGTVDTYTAYQENEDGEEIAVGSFNVYNGEDGLGTGDMKKTDYDPDNVVFAAGGIIDYVADQIAAAKPRVATVQLGTSWTASGGNYEQAVTISGVTATTKIDAEPDAAVIAQLYSDRVLGLYFDNDNGTVKAVAVGHAPTAALTVQVTLSEVSA